MIKIKVEHTFLILSCTYVRRYDWSSLAQDVTVQANKHYRITAMVKLLGTTDNKMYQEVSMMLTCKDSHGERSHVTFTTATVTFSASTIQTELGENK